MSRGSIVLTLAVAVALAAAPRCGGAAPPAAVSDQAAAAAPAPPAVAADTLVRHVRAYFSRRTTEQGGWLRILDPKTKVEVRLQVERFLADVAPTGPESWYLPGEMVSDRGFRYVVDFFVERKGEGFEVADVRIRQTEEDVRYRWVRQGEYWAPESP